jgi:hypothetical protein
MKKQFFTSTFLLGSFLALAQVPTDSLKGYYMFNNTMEDASVNAKNFTPFNQANNVTSYVAARNAASVSAVNNQATGLFSCSPFSSSDTGSFSVSLWAKMSAVDEGNTVTIIGDYRVDVDPMYNSFASGRFRITMYNKNPQFYLYTNDGQVLIDDFVDSVSVNTWNHLAAVYDHINKTAKFYLNGKQVSTTRTITSSPKAPGTVVDLGRVFVRRFSFNGPPTTATEGKFNGVIDDLALYNRVLNACEVYALAGSTPGSLTATVSVDELKLTAVPSNGESYQWINCTTNQPVAGATNSVFTAPSRGFYKVVVKGACASDTSDCVEAKQSTFPMMGLVGRYLFNNNTNDASPRNFPLTLINYPGAQNPAYTTNRKGAENSALNNSNGAFLYSSALFNDSQADTTDFTVSLWIKSNLVNVADAFLISDFAARDGNISGTFYVRVVNNQFRIGVIDSNRAVQFIDASIADGINSALWQNLQVVCNRKEQWIKLYLNGKDIATLYDFGRLSFAQAMYIGAYHKTESNVLSKGLPFNGLIDDIHVYNRILNTCELAELSETNTGTPNAYVSLDTINNTLICNNTGVNYQWINCVTGSPIPNATNKEFTPGASGSYAVVISTTCGSDTSSCVTYTAATGINEVFAERVNVYPNPTQQVLHITGAEVSYAYVYSLVGELVVTTTQSTIDLSSLKPGIYLVKLMNKEGSSVVKRIVKQ